MTSLDLPAILASHALWREGKGGMRANLRYANLSAANLSGANLSAADLSAANLSDANLSAANLSDANLSDADLSAANLSDANLSDANLCDANLSAADLCDANLSAADLSAANLSDANLHRVRGLQCASVAFTGHGELGRMLTAAKLGAKVHVFCGCFRGSPEDLREYISLGDAEYRPSRRLALRTVLKLLEVPRAKI
jgi:uncharacterized protein YjbI with pentapeptide repeats